MPSKGDLKFGQTAINLEYCEQEQLDECLKEQGKLEKQGKVTSIDRILLKKGYISAPQVAEIEKKQGRRIIFCAKCSSKLNVAIFGPGTKIRCPKCDASLVVPSATKFEVHEKNADADDEEKKHGTIRIKKDAGKAPAAAPAKPAARPAPKPAKKVELDEADLFADDDAAGKKEAEEEKEEEVLDDVDEVASESAEEAGDGDEPAEEEGETDESDKLADSDIELIDHDAEEPESKPAKPAALKARQNDPTEKMHALNKAKMPPSTTSKPGAAKPAAGGGSGSRLDRFKKK
ncbi:MAG: hypothetical protein HZA54_17180 [Planctomycetes bacterium]|nr:hypothetical protein [Planctomycetota bacterium]